MDESEQYIWEDLCDGGSSSVRDVVKCPFAQRITLVEHYYSTVWMLKTVDNKTNKHFLLLQG